jgi:glycosyltransferase involved in cell wall biosynthesis
MITNGKSDTYDAVVITNEMPVNRRGGVGSVMENMASGFSSSGVKVLWFLIDHHYSGAEIERILAGRTNIAIGSYEDLKMFRAPVINVHSYQHNSRLLHYLADKQVVYTIHSLLICEAESNGVDLSGPIRQQEELIGVCDKIVLVSQAELNDYYRVGYQKINPDVSVIHNGLKAPLQTQKRRNNKIIGFCGRLVPRKRPEYIPMILAEKGMEDYNALIAGRGFSPYARDLLHALNLKDRVRYLGWCGGERLESFYNQIDVLAIPSTYEPFGMVALEAVSRGIPVVCNRVGGLIEILGDYAFYSEDETYGTFHQAIDNWLAADDNTIETMIQGALRRYLRNFTDVRMAQRYANLFKSCAPLFFKNQ